MKPAVVVGGGIVGLAVARALQQVESRPVLVLEKESGVGAHQTGHNSGVIHSGLYYPPGSLKAVLAVEGASALKNYCAERGIPFDVPGKLVVATSDGDRRQLAILHERAAHNGVSARWLAAAEITEYEPHLRVAAAIHVGSTGRVDYRLVAAALADEITKDGGEIRTDTTVSSVRAARDGVRIVANTGDVEADRAAVCAGLHSDRLARASGLNPGVRILPFRGEYSELIPGREHLVRGLVYPVPDPDLPFLGVHLTRGIDGSVHIGPNAVPALAREGYSWGDVVARDVWESMTYAGSWRLARRYARTGAQEVSRSLAGRALVRAAQRMVPELRPSDVRRAGAGVRAQAVTRAGRLVDDFLFLRDGRTLHVLNAPSPAATACLPIGKRIALELCAA